MYMYVWQVLPLLLVLGFPAVGLSLSLYLTDQWLISGQRQDVRRGQRRRAACLIRYVREPDLSRD
jgi:hypothetical protein